ncbi:hypothetical protein NYE24_30770 [Paenibacillus sp. FSL H7-0350]|uniref:hypothetical protein n=1 Tax=Paenibacillus sp. FSL H7-0350 TaxID=2975345 RepID=UPI003158BA6C
MKKVLLESLNVNDLRNLLAGGELPIKRSTGDMLRKHFSITDIRAEEGTPYVEIPGVSMVFDLAGSSASIRQNGPQAFVDKYAEVFNHLTSIIYINDGIIEKFPGDGISAHFLKKGAEENIESAKERAVIAADSIRKYMGTILTQRNFRITMWSGTDTIATFIGNDHHREMISIGHGVNVAHKIEKTVKHHECVIGMDASLANKYSALKLGTYRQYPLPPELVSGPVTSWYGVSNA